MVLAVNCKCGEIYHAEERHVGGNIRCRKCSRIIVIDNPTSGHKAEKSPVNPTFVSTKTAAHSIFSNRIVLWVCLVASMLLIVFITSILHDSKEQHSIITRSNVSGVSSSLSAVSPSPVTTSSQKQTLETSGSLVSLPNGTEISSSRGSKGHGTLKVINGTSYDAAVRLVDKSSMKTRRLVYVRANSEIIIKNIGAGNCLLQFSSGTGWEQGKRKFLYDQSYSQFDDVLEFIENKTNDGIYWQNFEVTLHPVLAGNAKTSSITESDFEDK